MCNVCAGQCYKMMTDLCSKNSLPQLGTICLMFKDANQLPLY